MGPFRSARSMFARENSSRLYISLSVRLTYLSSKTMQVIARAFSLGVFYDDYISGILPSFSDIQTVLLACISTLLPLIIALGIAFGCRYANFSRIITKRIRHSKTPFKSAEDVYYYLNFGAISNKFF